MGQSHPVVPCFPRQLAVAVGARSKTLLTLLGVLIALKATGGAWQSIHSIDDNAYAPEGVGV